MSEKIVVARHGKPIFEGKDAGLLTTEGLSQARALAPKILTFFGQIETRPKLLTSLAPRARVYAKILAGILGVSEEVDTHFGDIHGFVDRTEITYPHLNPYLVFPLLILVSHETFTSEVMEYLGADPDKLIGEKKGWRTMFYSLEQGQAYAFDTKTGITEILLSE